MHCHSKKWQQEAISKQASLVNRWALMTQEWFFHYWQEHTSADRGGWCFPDSWARLDLSFREIFSLSPSVCAVSVRPSFQGLRWIILEEIMCAGLGLFFFSFCWLTATYVECGLPLIVNFSLFGVGDDLWGRRMRKTGNHRNEEGKVFENMIGSEKNFCRLRATGTWERGLTQI